MNENVGTADRVIRAVLGLAIMAIGYNNASYWGYLGLLPLATAAASWCPFYAMFGASTCARLKLKV
jgi:hypothetical protein